MLLNIGFLACPTRVGGLSYPCIDQYGDLIRRVPYTYPILDLKTILKFEVGRGGP